MAEDKDRPIFISIIAILYFLGGLILVIGGILIALGTITASVASGEPVLGLSGTALGAFAALMGIIYLIVAGGLWNGWGIMWYLGVIISIVSIISSIISILASGPFGILGIILNLLIIYYLFRPKVKEFFGI